MKPEWRTQTVTALCVAMLGFREFRTVPLLADALLEAGCDDEDLLEACRMEKDWVCQERLVNLIYSEETEAAVRWLDDFARKGGTHGWDNEKQVDYAMVMTAANDYAETGEQFIQINDESLRDNCCGERANEFWKHWSKVTGRPPKFSEHGVEGPFSCSC